LLLQSSLSFFFFIVPPPTAIYTLSLHDALPIFPDLLRPDGHAFKPSDGSILPLTWLPVDMGDRPGPNVSFWIRRFRGLPDNPVLDRKSTRLNSSHLVISYAVFCLKKKNKKNI